MKSPWLSTLSVAEYLDLRDRKTGAPSIRAAYEWINAHIPPEKVRKIGRAVRVHRDDVDAAIRFRSES